MNTKNSYVAEDDICALATPFAQSALAVIRLSGPGTIEKFAALFSSPNKLKTAKGNTLHFGYVLNRKENVQVDQVMVSLYRAPHSYTGEDSIEVSCHGSLPGIELLLALFYQNGFRAASPGEFTLRAFLNKKIDLTQAEAVHELVTSKSSDAHRLALDRLSGSVFEAVDSVKQNLIELLASVEIQLDYPGDEIDDSVFLDREKVYQSILDLERLSQSFQTGKIYREGISVVLCGKTNAGKSSVFNRLLKEDRSIVSEVHGTTRDYLESWISVKGVPVRLYDTAGIRHSDDPIESEGIRRAKEKMDHADLVLAVYDSTEESGLESSFYLPKNKTIVKIWNKVDLAKKGDSVPPSAIPFSSKTGVGVSEVEEAILRFAKKGDSQSGTVLIDSIRQKELIDCALDSLKLVYDQSENLIALDGIAVDLKDALDALGEITGEVTTSDLLEKMFSSFCVGK